MFRTIQLIPDTPLYRPNANLKIKVALLIGMAKVADEQQLLFRNLSPGGKHDNGKCTTRKRLAWSLTQPKGGNLNRFNALTTKRRSFWLAKTKRRKRVRETKRVRSETFFFFLNCRCCPESRIYIILLQLDLARLMQP